MNNDIDNVDNSNVVITTQYSPGVFNMKRMQEALVQPSISIPMGLSREEKMAQLLLLAKKLPKD